MGWSFFHDAMYPLTRQKQVGVFLYDKTFFRFLTDHELFYDFFKCFFDNCCKVFPSGAQYRFHGFRVCYIFQACMRFCGWNSSYVPQWVPCIFPVLIDFGFLNLPLFD